MKWLFLVSLLVYLVLIVAQRLPFLGLPLPPGSVTAKYLLLFWTITNALYFASFLIVPWTGNRNYCRYLCPWRALYGAVGKLGFFKIVADRDACVPCRICEVSCDMGVPIRSLVKQYGEISVVDCVGCGRCVENCPRGALQMVDIRDYGHAISRLIVKR